MGQALHELIEEAIKRDSDEAKREKLERLKTHYLVPTHPRHKSDLLFRGTRTACVCEVRAAGYLTSTISQLYGTTPEIVPDYSMWQTPMYEKSVIAIGAKDNSMTETLLRDPGNDLVDIEVNAEAKTAHFISRSGSGERLTPNREEAHDYGLIIAINPEGRPDKKWIACAGLGEYGTSGTAHYLSNNWELIAREVSGSGKFACIVRVRVRHDDSANRYWFTTTPSIR
jgi:hypothetical protein